MTKREKRLNEWIDARAASFKTTIKSDMPTEARINILMEAWAHYIVFKFARAGKPKNKLRRIKSIVARLQAVNDAECRMAALDAEEKKP